MPGSRSRDWGHSPLLLLPPCSKEKLDPSCCGPRGDGGGCRSSWMSHCVPGCLWCAFGGQQIKDRHRRDRQGAPAVSTNPRTAVLPGSVPACRESSAAAQCHRCLLTFFFCTQQRTLCLCTQALKNSNYPVFWPHPHFSAGVTINISLVGVWKEEPVVTGEVERRVSAVVHLSAGAGSGLNSSCRQGERGVSPLRLSNAPTSSQT